MAGLKSLFLMNSFALLTVVNTKPIWTPPPNPHPITVALNSNLLSSLLTLFDVSVRVVFFFLSLYLLLDIPYLSAVIIYTYSKVLITCCTTFLLTTWKGSVIDRKLSQILLFCPQQAKYHLSFLQPCSTQ